MNSSSGLWWGPGRKRPGPRGWLAGVLLHEGEDLRDVGLVDEGRTGQHGLAATEDVAVPQVEVELGDGQVALQVGLLVDEELDLPLTDGLRGVRIGVERADLGLGPDRRDRLDGIQSLGGPEGDDPVDGLVLAQLGLDRGG